MMACVEWKSERLCDLPIQIVDGDRSSRYPKRHEFQPEGIVFLNSTNIVDNRLTLTDCNRISEEKYAQITKGRTQPDDIVMTTRGSIGKVALVKRDVLPRGLINAQMLLMRADREIIDPSFLFYVTCSVQFQAEVQNFASGSAQPQIPITDLRQVSIFYPPLPTQRKIASILSAYDDLIQNNTRRIKILEEMAQRIYREWFVNFHFPGHEKVKMVESELGMIPEGWEVKRLGDVLETLESGSRPKGGIDPTVTEVPSVGAENVLGLGKYDYSKEKFVTREFYEGMRKGHVKSEDVLLYKDGAKIGRKSMFMDGFPHDECCINEHAFILRTNDLCSQAYLYFWLDLPKVTRDIINLNANAAQPGINQKSVKSLTILLADAMLKRRFDEIAFPVLTELFNLAKKNQILRRTRDLLLPKLITSELDVSELDIETGGNNT